jgi:hypothetical protein
VFPKRRGLWLAAAPAFLFLALSCRTVPLALEPPTGPLLYALVFVIHGDGSYLFHDDGGKPHEADQVALERARATAKANPEAEVFVFHQHDRRGLTRKNGTFELYRNGALVLLNDYRRDSGGMEAEIAIYRDLTRLGHRSDVRRFFLYFGHQIPELPQPGYHGSIPQASFGLERLADGLAGFLPSGNRFDLVVLSTCNNGTPTAVAALAPRARYLTASPADLYLSHLTTETLHHLERREPMEVGLLARELALAAFRDLTEQVSTIVTVSVYDIDTLAPRVSEAAAELRARLASADSLLEFYDCGEDPRLSWLAGLPGVTIYYRPPRFGRERSKETHSGLQCFRSP